MIRSASVQVEHDAPVSETSPHIANIGRMVEDMENKIRNTLNEIYFGKTKDIVNGLRSTQPLADQRQQQNLKQDLATALKQRGGAKDKDNNGSGGTPSTGSAAAVAAAANSN